MRYIAKTEEVIALQVMPVNLDKIAETFDGYRRSGNQIISDTGNVVKESYWIVSDGKSTVVFSDNVFNKLYKEKPVDKFTLSEAIAIGIDGRKLRRDWYDEGVYLKWAGFAWVMEMGGDLQLYALTPSDIMDKEWIIC